MAGPFEVWAAGELPEEGDPATILRKAKNMFPLHTPAQLARLIGGGPSIAAHKASAEDAARLAAALISIGIRAKVRRQDLDATLPPVMPKPTPFAQASESAARASATMAFAAAAANARAARTQPEPSAKPSAQPQVAPSAQSALDAVLAAEPSAMGVLGQPRQRLTLGILVAVIGGLVGNQSLLLGLPIAGLGAWLILGSSVTQLREQVKSNVPLLLSWIAGLLFFFGAIYQASRSLGPIVPLFAISALLLPPFRQYSYELTRWRMSSGVREGLIVLLLCVYGWMLRSENEQQVLQAKQVAWNRMAQTAHAQMVQDQGSYLRSHPQETYDRMQRLIDRGRYQDAIDAAQEYYSQSGGQNEGIAKLRNQAKAGLIRQQLSATPYYEHHQRGELYAELSRYADDQDYWSMYRDEERQAREEQRSE